MIDVRGSISTSSPMDIYVAACWQVPIKNWGDDIRPCTNTQRQVRLISDRTRIISLSKKQSQWLVLLLIHTFGISQWRQTWNQNEFISLLKCITLLMLFQTGQLNLQLTTFPFHVPFLEVQSWSNHGSIVMLRLIGTNTLQIKYWETMMCKLTQLLLEEMDSSKRLSQLLPQRTLQSTILYNFNFGNDPGTNHFHRVCPDKWWTHIWLSTGSKYECSKQISHQCCGDRNSEMHISDRSWFHDHDRCNEYYFQYGRHLLPRIYLEASRRAWNRIHLHRVSQRCSSVFRSLIHLKSWHVFLHNLCSNYMDLVFWKLNVGFIFECIPLWRNLQSEWKLNCPRSKQLCSEWVSIIHLLWFVISISTWQHQ